MNGAGDDPAARNGRVDEVDPVAERILTALLAIDPAAAAAARAGTPARRRPRRQRGPVADFGDGARPS